MTLRKMKIEKPKERNKNLNSKTFLHHFAIKFLSTCSQFLYIFIPELAGNTEDFTAASDPHFD